MWEIYFGLTNTGEYGLGNVGWQKPAKETVVIVHTSVWPPGPEVTTVSNKLHPIHEVSMLYHNHYN